MKLITYNEGYLFIGSKNPIACGPKSFLSFLAALEAFNTIKEDCNVKPKIMDKDICFALNAVHLLNYHLLLATPTTLVYAAKNSKYIRIVQFSLCKNSYKQKLYKASELDLNEIIQRLTKQKTTLKRCGFFAARDNDFTYSSNMEYVHNYCKERLIKVLPKDVVALADDVTATKSLTKNIAKYNKLLSLGVLPMKFWFEE